MHIPFSKLMVIYEGTFYNHDDEFYGQIEINPDTGIIENVSRNLSGTADVKFEKHLLVFPGFSDIHVHFRESLATPTPNHEYLEQLLQENFGLVPPPEPGRLYYPVPNPKDIKTIYERNEWKDLSYKEDADTGSAAAINGGVILTMPMPNIDPAPINEFFYYHTQNKINRTQIPIIQYAAIRPGSKPIPGIVPYKVYMGHSFGNTGYESLDLLEHDLQFYRGQFVSFHVEHPRLLEKYKNEKTHQERRPSECEIEGTPIAIKLVKKYSLRAKFCHWSTEIGLDHVINSRKEGTKIELEATPEHCYFYSDDMNEEERLMTQCNPAIHTKENQIAILGGLKSGEIDHLATDHAPHTKEDKAKGMSGMPSLDTYGPFTTWLMYEHNFTPQDIARIASYNPGKFANNFLHLTGKNYGTGFGKIEQGYYGSLTVINMKKGIKIKEKDLKTKCGWSPFTGITFPGRVEHVVLGGNKVK